MAAGFFEDDNGNKSSARLRAFIVLMGFMIVWGTVAIVKKDIPSIPESVLIFVLSVCGITTVQRIWGEKTPEKPAAPSGSAHLSAVILLLVLLMGILAVAHAETREESRARLSAISARCAERTNEYFFGEEMRRASDCLRIGSLHDDLYRCASERNRLRVAAGCDHDWQDIGPGTRYCRECRSIAHFLGGRWMVTFTGGMWVGPDPLDYPREYGLR